MNPEIEKINAIPYKKGQSILKDLKSIIGDKIRSVENKSFEKGEFDTMNLTQNQNININDQNNNSSDNVSDDIFGNMENF